MSTSFIVLLAIVGVFAVIVIGPLLVMKMADYSHSRTLKHDVRDKNRNDRA